MLKISDFPKVRSPADQDSSKSGIYPANTLWCVFWFFPVRYVAGLTELQQQHGLDADLPALRACFIVAALHGSQKIKSDLEQARLELESARRAGDLTRMSELQYGVIPELEKTLDMAGQAAMMEMTLLRNKVTDEEVAEVVSRWTGIPVSKMLEGEREKLLTMEASLSERVIGQNEAVIRPCACRWGS